MTRLLDPAQLKRLRQAWRAELAARPDLKAKVRRRKRSPRRQRPTSWIAHQLFFVVFGCGLLAAIFAGKLSIELQLAWVVMFLLGIQFSLVDRLGVTLYGSPEIGPLFLSPVSDEDIFRFLWRRWLGLAFGLMLPVYALFATLFILNQRTVGSLLLALPISFAAACLLDRKSVG